VYLLAALLRPDRAVAANTAKATIADAGVKFQRGLVLLRFRVDGAFTPEMVEAIQSGLPTVFKFQLRLFRDLDKVPDERVYASQLDRTIVYDTLRQQYDVSTGDDHWTAKSLDEAERLMTRLDDIAVALVAGLDPESRYYAIVKAELAEVRLPFVLSFLRSFVQIWDFETPWTRIEIPAREAAK
jgi:hypothetical protein